MDGIAASLHLPDGHHLAMGGLALAGLFALSLFFRRRAEVLECSVPSRPATDGAVDAADAPATVVAPPPVPTCPSCGEVEYFSAITGCYCCEWRPPLSSPHAMPRQLRAVAESATEEREDTLPSAPSASEPKGAV